MQRKSNKNRETGLTLVEILASLVILGIVFVAFMTIFPQMTLFNERTETKLETMNEARIVLEEYKNRKFSKEVLSKSSCRDNIEWACITNEKFSSADIRIKKKADAPMDNLVKTVPRQKILHRIHIKMNKDNEVISESFGYVEVE